MMIGWGDARPLDLRKEQDLEYSFQKFHKLPQLCAWGGFSRRIVLYN